MKLNLNEMLSDKRVLKLLSLAAAFILWFTVANSVSDDHTFTISNVPVDFENLSSNVMSRLGLEAMVLEEVSVEVTVEGKRYIVGNVKPEDLKITPDISKVQGAGIYPISLSGTDVNNLGFDVVGITPSTVSVRFDRFASKKLTIESEITGVSTMEGYLIENEIITPNEVVITGPESDIALVSRCVARVNVENVLSNSYSGETTLVLLDQEGNEVDSPYISLSETTAQVTIPILKTKELPLTVDFINIPENFPIDQLDFNLSKKTLKVAGPAASIDRMEELSLGYVDFKNLGTDSAFDFDVELPAGYVNIENVKTVQVSFNLEDYRSVFLNLTDIRPINVPEGYEAVVETLQLEVEVVGPADIVSTMDSDELFAEVDLSNREVDEGEYTSDIRIYSPDGLPVWVRGNYEAIVSIRLAEQ